LFSEIKDGREVGTPTHTATFDFEIHRLIPRSNREVQPSMAPCHLG